MLLNVHSLGASFVSCFHEKYIVVTRVEKLLKQQLDHHWTVTYTQYATFVPLPQNTWFDGIVK